eukprot:118440-Rhodomonas_salina.3
MHHLTDRGRCTRGLTSRPGPREKAVSGPRRRRASQREARVGGEVAEALPRLGEENHDVEREFRQRRATTLPEVRDKERRRSPDVLVQPGESREERARA